jgi:pilus assembly protein Flp/PilA
MTRLYWRIHLLWSRRDERGASLVEYALLLALIAVVCFVAVAVLGGSVSAKFSSNASAVAGAGG